LYHLSYGKGKDCSVKGVVELQKTNQKTSRSGLWLGKCGPLIINGGAGRDISKDLQKNQGELSQRLLDAPLEGSKRGYQLKGGLENLGAPSTTVYLRIRKPGFILMVDWGNLTTRSCSWVRGEKEEWCGIRQKKIGRKVCPRFLLEVRKTRQEEGELS